MADAVFVQMVGDALGQAADLGETRSRAQLQETVGIGAGDLDAVLDELRTSGRAVEETPDEWTTPGVPVPDRGVPEVVEAPEPELPGRPRSPAPAEPDDDEAEDRRVELTGAVAKALDEATLGKLVKAGIDDAASAGVAFEFVVLP